MAVTRLRCDADSFGSISYHWYYRIRSEKIQLCSVVPPTKPTQTISSILSPKNQLVPNWQQSTTKMAVARLRCNAYSFGSISYHWYYHIRPGKNTSLLRCTAIFVVDCCQFGPSWIFGLKMELMAGADLVGGIPEQRCLSTDLIW